MKIQQHSIPNQVCVCVDEARGGCYTGRFYHEYRADGTPFDSLQHLMTQMDAFFDQIDYPQSLVQLRSFTPTEPDYAARRAAKEALLAHKGEGDLDAHTGKAATFQVYVQFRQSASWQGALYWAERDETVYFRSALEFMALMDEAVAKGEP